MNDCIFCKIINKEIPATLVYEDDDVIAFRDINPLTPVHILFVPKKHFDNILQVNEDNPTIISKIYFVINKVANTLGVAQDGFRVVVNCGKNGGQIVKHLHFHLLAGQKLGNKIG